METGGRSTTCPPIGPLAWICTITSPTELGFPSRAGSSGLIARSKYELPNFAPRQYHPVSKDHGSTGDTAYALAFTTQGELVVRVTKHHAEQYKAPDVYDIGRDELATVKVNGSPLIALVLAKLNEILPIA